MMVTSLTSQVDGEMNENHRPHTTLNELNLNAIPCPMSALESDNVYKVQDILSMNSCENR